MTAYYNNGRFNGSVLVAERGKVIFKKGYGMANMEWGIPNTPDTKFRLGSITKQFTAMLIMQLVEQGKVKLDGKLSDYLPDYRKDIGERVTIHHLLTHTSGIPSYTNLPGFIQNLSRDPWKVGDFVKKYTSGDLTFEPGSKFAYNNSGYFLLGAIIEQVTGKPYEQVLKENIFDPLGMKNTGYDHHNTILSKRASGYEKRPSGVINAPYLDMSIPYAAGSLYSTVEDLYLWDQALYTDKLISPESKALMFKTALNNYAYGFFVAKLALGNTKETVSAISHGGGINGFSTVIVRLVDDRHLIVLLNNTGSTRLEEMGRSIAAILYGKTYDLPLRSIADAIRQTIADKGIQAAIRQYRDLKRTQPRAYDFRERELDTLGHQLLAAGNVKDAIEIFKLNVEAYPEAFNTYDSLAEAYQAAGDIELAIKNYRKSLELNPQNTGAAEMLKKLTGK
jgi:CubicO group peptidase (beta-lactamase class C family)